MKLDMLDMSTNRLDSNILIRRDSSNKIGFNHWPTVRLQPARRGKSEFKRVVRQGKPAKPILEESSMYTIASG